MYITQTNETASLIIYCSVAVLNETQPTDKTSNAYATFKKTSSEMFFQIEVHGCT